MNFPEPSYAQCHSCGHMDHIGICSRNDCDCIIYPSHTLKEYKAPQLLQLRLEEHVAQAAAKWFELENFIIEQNDRIVISGLLGDKKIHQLENEEIGKKAVLLLKKE